MIGSFLTRALALILGYAYPAYECYKTVELNRPEINQLRFWCQYWILVAVLTVFERVGESFVSWLPMYSEAKVAFFLYLWYPKTRGTSYVYETFFRPYVAKHETEIDRNLLELRTRAGDMVVLYSQRIASYGQTRFFEILQFVAAQSPSRSSRPRASQLQPRQQPQQNHQSAPVTSTNPPQQLARPPPPPASPKKRQSREPSTTTTSPPLVDSSNSQPTQPLLNTATATAAAAAEDPQLQTASKSLSSSTSSSDPEPMQVEVTNNATLNQESNNPPPPPPQETLMEEAIRMTRGRLRKRAAVSVSGGA